MCFTPVVSLSTAVIEWVLATILLVFFEKTTLRKYLAAIIYVLGFYQFTEFMLCTTSSPLLWAKIGFITYSFLPAIGLHSILRILKRKSSIFLIYFVPVGASLLAILTPNFILWAKCTSVFVQIQILFRDYGGFLNTTLYWIYMLYYFGFMVVALVILLKDYLHQRNKIQKEIDIVEIIGAFMMVGPTLVLVIILPYLNLRFPSVLCFFAIFFAIATFAIAYLETKLKKKQKNRH